MKKIVFSIIILSFLLTACNKDSVRGSGEAVVHINASLAEAEAVTKHPIIDGFPDNSSSLNSVSGNGTYGIFVFKNGTTSVAHKSNSRNILARYTTADGWNYYYVSNLSNGAVALTGYDHITLTARDDHATADLYAYAPYTQSAYSAGPTAIPYSMANDISHQADLMYAVQNKATFDDETPEHQDGNEDLDPTSAFSLNATFTFKHAFSLLAFCFKIRNGEYGLGSSYILSNITVTKSEGETTAKLYRKGTFNALTGTFNNDGEEAPSLSVHQLSLTNGNVIINTHYSYTTAYLMLVPTDVDDDELVFTFTMNDHTLQPFSLKRSQLLHSDGVTYGFQSGYKYIFNFTLDNYLYFDGFSVGKWTTPVTPLGEENI